MSTDVEVVPPSTRGEEARHSHVSALVSRARMPPSTLGDEVRHIYVPAPVQCTQKNPINRREYVWGFTHVNRCGGSTCVEDADATLYPG